MTIVCGRHCLKYVSESVIILWDISWELYIYLSDRNVFSISGCLSFEFLYLLFLFTFRFCLMSVELLVQALVAFSVKESINVQPTCTHEEIVINSIVVDISDRLQANRENGKRLVSEYFREIFFFRELLSTVRSSDSFEIIVGKIISTTFSGSWFLGIFPRLKSINSRYQLLNFLLL